MKLALTQPGKSFAYYKNFSASDSFVEGIPLKLFRIYDEGGTLLLSGELQMEPLDPEWDDFLLSMLEKNWKPGLGAAFIMYWVSETGKWYLLNEGD